MRRWPHRAAAAPDRRPPPRATPLIWWGAALAAIALAGAAVAERGARSYTEAGFTFPGWPTDLAAATLRTVGDLSGAVTVGALAFAAIVAAPSAAGRLTVDGYGALTIARRAAPVWLTAAVLLTPVSAANTAGQPVGSLLHGGLLLRVIGQTLPSRAWLVAAVVALVVVIGTRSVLTFAGAAGLAVTGALGLLPAAVVGNAGEGLGHDVATAAIIVHVVATAAWLGGTVATAARLRRGGPGAALLLRRAGLLSVGCAVAVAVSGFALAANLVAPSQIFSTQYGLLTAAKAIAFAALVAGAWVLVRVCARRVEAGRVRAAARVLAGQGAVLILAVGASVGMAQQPAARFLVTDPNPSEQEIGYALPHPPGLATLAGDWRFDLVLGGASLVAAAAYLAGARRLRRIGRPWPARRTLAFLAGCLCLLLTTSSGIAAYAEATFSMHMVAHMLLNMVVPVLLVLGGPLSLIAECRAAGGTGTPPTARPASALPASAPPAYPLRLDRLVHSLPVRFLTNPFGAVATLCVLLFGVYLTPIFGYAVGYHWAHELMNIAFLVSGYFLFWQIVGVDPLPRRLPHLARLALLVALMPVHAIFGVAILTRQTVMGLVFYGGLDLPWLHGQVADQHLGAVIVWIGGEVPLVIVAVMVMVDWWRSDAGPVDPGLAIWDELSRRRVDGTDRV